MDSERIMAFVQEHQELLSMAAGAAIAAGAALDWDWLCGPAGAPRSHRYGRGARRAIFFLGGVVLMVVSVWSLALAG